MTERKSKDSVMLMISSASGLGLLPIAPGSFGALLGVIIHIVLKELVSEELLIYFIGVFIFVLLILSYYSLKWARVKYGTHDPKNFVLDEVIGYLITAFFTYNLNFYLSVILCFLFFRIFDIIKIPPAYQIDKKMKGYWGVILDDVVSALYAVICIKVVIFFFF